MAGKRFCDKPNCHKLLYNLEDHLVKRYPWPKAHIPNEHLLAEQKMYDWCIHKDCSCAGFVLLHGSNLPPNREYLSGLPAVAALNDPTTLIKYFLYKPSIVVPHRCSTGLVTSGTQQADKATLLSVYPTLCLMWENI